MTTTFTIIGSIFGIISGICFKFGHINLGLFIAVFAVLSFIIALCVNLSKKQGAKINRQEFTFVDPPGYYTHPNYNYPICPICLKKYNRISPLSKMDKTSWLCNVCRQPTIHSKGDVFSLDD
jgi:hypothetical protein